MNTKPIFFTISPLELSELLRTIIKQEISTTLSVTNGNENLLTRKQTANLLKISLVTLDEYTKRGFIKAKKIGKRILYNKFDINNALSSLN